MNVPGDDLTPASPEEGEPAKSKWCSGCKSEKPVEGFWKNQTRCKECQRTRLNADGNVHARRYSAWRHGLRVKFRKL